MSNKIKLTISSLQSVCLVLGTVQYNATESDTQIIWEGSIEKNVHPFVYEY